MRLHPGVAFALAAVGSALFPLRASARIIDAVSDDRNVFVNSYADEAAQRAKTPTCTITYRAKLKNDLERYAKDAAIVCHENLSVLVERIQGAPNPGLKPVHIDFADKDRIMLMFTKAGYTAKQFNDEYAKIKCVAGLQRHEIFCREDLFQDEGSRQYKGVVVHEMAHVVLGDGSKDSPPFWYNEGLADYMRYKLMVDNPWGCSAGKTYKDGYTCAAALLAYAEKTYHLDIPKLSQSVRTGQGVDAGLAAQLEGKTWPALWSECQNRPAGTTAPLGGYVEPGCKAP